MHSSFITYDFQIVRENIQYGIQTQHLAPKCLMVKVRPIALSLIKNKMIASTEHDLSSHKAQLAAKAKH